MKTAVRLFALVAAVLLTLTPSTWGQTVPVVTILHSFVGGGTDGLYPIGGLVQGSDGNFYGTTYQGGSSSGGTVFSITPAGVPTILYSFTGTGTDGEYPEAGLVQGSDGNFYGTTQQGGSGGYGTVFSITPAGVLTTLHSFSSTDGNSPQAGLVQGSDGNFYGTTQQGGSGGYGTVFSITSAGVLTTLYNFTGTGTDGEYPYAALVQGSDGNFYGTTAGGGGGTYGTVFSITPAGVPTTLYSFTGTGTDGEYPYAALVQGSDGNFYGTTVEGGSSLDGTVFSITPAGVLTTLYNFTGTDGANPRAGLVQGSDGNFYGTTFGGGSSGSGGYGTVFSITPAGVLTTLYNFTGTGTDGANPRAGLVQGSDGNFYGTTIGGGSSTYGTFFKLSFVPSPGTLQFAAATYTVNENAGSVSLTVQRVGGSAGAVSVSYSESDGTADTGSDYQGASGILNWADGDATDKTITVPIYDRGITDGSTRVFSAQLSAPTNGAAIGAPSVATVSILENDAPTFTPTPTPPPTPTPTPTPTATPPPTPIATPPPTPTATPTLPPPTVAIVSPPDGVTVVGGSALPLAVSILNPGSGVVSVQFLINGAVVDTTSATAPYVFATTAPATADTYSIEAIATDDQGRTGTSTITLHVIAPVMGTTPPASALLTPVAGRSLAAGSTVTLDFSVAADPTTALAQVTLYADGVPIATFDGDGNPTTSSAATARPTRRDAPGALHGTLFQANYTLPATDKIVNLVAVALDKLGQSTVSAAASIHATVTDHAAPLVSLGGIASGTHFEVGSNTTVSVDASASAAQAASRLDGPARDDASSTLALLEYYLNGTRLAQATQPPFTFTFTPPTAGKYVLHAVATDSTGLATVSAPVIVEADAPPMVSVAAGGGVVVEGAGGKGIAVFTRTGDTSADLIVSYKVKGGAKAGVDFKPPTGTLTIPAGSAKAKLKLKTLAGAAFDGTRVAKVVLLPSADGSYMLGTAAVAKLKFVAAP